MIIGGLLNTVANGGLLAGALGAGQPDPVFPAYMGQVVTRSSVSNNATTGVTSYNKPTAHVVRQGGLTSMTVSYASIYVIASQPPNIPTAEHGVETAASALTGTVTIEQPLGTVLGTGSLSVPAGQEASVAITLSQAPAESSIIWIRYNLTAAGGVIPYMSAGGGDNAWQEIGEAINALYPCRVEGMTTKPTFTLYDNSRVAGNNDLRDANGNVGEWAKAIGARYAFRNCGVPTDEYFWFSRNRTWRAKLGDNATHICVNGDINGTRAARGNWSAAQCYADAQNICKLFPGKALIFNTSPPAALSATTPDSADAQRVALNALIRAQPSPIASVVDAARLFDANDDGLWDNAAMTADWVHESPLGYTTLANTISPLTLAKLAPVAQFWSRWSLLPTTSVQGSWFDANDAGCLNRFAVNDDTTPVLWTGKNNFGTYNQTVAGNKPVLTANVSGSLSAYRFTAASSQDMAASGTPRRVLNAATGFFFVALVIPGAAGANARYIYYLSTETDATLNRLGIALTAAGKINAVVRRANGETSTSITGVTTVSTSAPLIISAYADMAGATRTLNLRLNSLADATPVTVNNAAGPFSSSDAASSMFGSSNSIANSFFDGYIFEANVFPGVFTLDQIQRAEADIAWSNGLQSILDASNPYKTNRPT